MRAKKILLIDDDIEVLAVLQLALQIDGYEAEVTDDLSQAQVWLREREFDLVVCDVMMPTENGTEFRERLTLTNRNLPPFLFCSGLPSEFLSKPYPQGVAGMLLKPFTIKKFLEEIRAHVNSVERGHFSREISHSIVSHL
jgi:DNA-binding response OmpR family regulator